MPFSEARQRATDSLTAVIAFVGPTGTGKSEAAILTAKRLASQGVKAEVINTDAMQFYRGMDIGTAKVGESGREGIKHHMIDIMEVTEEASAASFQEEARALISRMHENRIVPILVGGSGLYNRAVLDVLEFPPTDGSVRERIDRDVTEAAGGDGERAARILRRRLEAVDPVSAARNLDFRRLVRALEVYCISGKPFSAYMPQRIYYQRTFQYGLRAERETLHRRLAERVHGMVRQGLLAETRRLERLGLRSGKTASRAVGYAQMLQVLDNNLTIAQAKEKTIAATRQLARRQQTWFGADPRVKWFDPSAPDYPEALFSQILRDLNPG